LATRSPGDARVPAIDVKVGDKVYRTEPIDVKVVSSGAVPKVPVRQRGAPPAGDRDPGLSEVRLENEATADKVYVGQPIVLPSPLLTRVQVLDVSQVPDPTLPGFILEESEPNPSPERVFREGREYTSVILMRRILPPPPSGRSETPAEKRTIRIR